MRVTMNMLEAGWMKTTAAEKTSIPGVLDGQERNALVQALRNDDKKRRIAEAKALFDAQ